MAPKRPSTSAADDFDIDRLQSSDILSVYEPADPIDYDVPVRLPSNDWFPSARPNRVRVARLELEDGTLILSRVGPSLLEGRLDEDHALVSLWLDHDLRTIADGTMTPLHHIAIAAPTARYCAFWRTAEPEGHILATLVVERRVLPPVWPATGDTMLIFDVSSEDLEELRGRYCAAFRAAVEAPESLATAGARRAILGDLIASIVTVLSSPRTRPTRPSDVTLSHRATIARIDAYIDRRGNAPIMLEDVARELDVAPRTIHNIMTRVRGMTLQAYVKVTKLRAVRRDLLFGDDSQLVKQAAIRQGFMHQGRFARDYLLQFGETPSATLARRRRRNGKTAVTGEETSSDSSKRRRDMPDGKISTEN